MSQKGLFPIFVLRFPKQEDFIPPPPMDETSAEKMERISSSIRVSVFGDFPQSFSWAENYPPTLIEGVFLPFSLTRVNALTLLSLTLRGYQAIYLN